MKAMFLTVALFSVSTLASAGLVGDFPKVQFGSTFVSVDGICVRGENVETLNPVEVCTQRGAHNKYCDVSESKILSTPIHFTTEIPWGRNGMKKINATIATDYKIAYGVETGKGFKVVKYVDFSLPECN